MQHPSPAASASADPRPADPLPWPSLVVLGAAAFLMVTAEMLPTALLPQLAAGLGVDAPRVGLLVSLWAGVVVVASFPLVRLVARRDRRTVVAAALVLLAASSGLSAAAPDYGWMVGARLVGALAVGLLWATINAHTADIVPDSRLAPAVAVVLGGATLGTVLGTSGASLVGVATSWRVPFGVLGGLALVAAVLVRAVVVAAPHPAAARPAAAPRGPAARPDGARRPRVVTDPMLVVTALVALVLVGHYGAFTYITRLTERPAAALPGGTATLLLVFGTASALGIAAAGRYGTRTSAALLLSSLATAGAVLALTLVDAHPVVGVTVVVLWGAVSGALPALAQTLILRLAGPGRRTLAGALIPVLFNLGVAAGAGLASAVVAGGGIGALPVVSAAVIGVAVLGQALTAGGRRAAVSGAPGARPPRSGPRSRPRPPRPSSPRG
ncbi:MFS transporter [Cellulomonas cellasea]|uniref:MFS transporter n=1 Tax=Cellulomonas cellasea TaxID=43670 RepID=A0A4Y3KUD3_9CELL|nr:MFS transporter [Cellulomonas cellasea]